MADDNEDSPHWLILEGVAASLAAAPAIEGLGTPKVRELPYVLAQADGDPPFCFVCPPDGRGERLVRTLFKSGPGRGEAIWSYPVLVLLITAGNRALSSGLRARLRTRHNAARRLFVPLLPGVGEVYDCDPDPRGVIDVQAALGTNYVVSGYQFDFRRPLHRSA